MNAVDITQPGSAQERQAVPALPQQALLRQILPELEQLDARYPGMLDALQETRRQMEDFTVRVPLVGTFSAGKSSLINALLGEDLFAVEITPETALPVELSHAAQERFIGHRPQQPATLEFSRAQVKRQDFAALQPDGWLQARLPCPLLGRFPHLTLVDMPGWNSGIEQHARAIDEYLGRSLAYCLVVSVDEGSLHASVRGFLQELAALQMPFLLVLNKCDKKLPEDVAAIEAAVLREIAKLTPMQPVAVVQASARRKAIGTLAEALLSLQQRVPERFASAIVQPVLQQLQFLDRHLELLIGAENLRAEELQLERERTEQELRHFQDHLEQETTRMEAEVEPAMQHIRSLVHSRLLEQLDSLASLALHHGDLQGSLGRTLRLVLREGIEQEFVPKIRRYLRDVEAEWPETFALGNLPPLEVGGGGSPDVNLGPLLNIAALISTQLAKLGPLGLAIGTVITAVAGLLSGLFGGGGGQQAEQESQRQQRARQHVQQSIIPQVLQEIAGPLRSMLNLHLQQTKEQIRTLAEDQSRKYQHTLEQLEQQLREDREQFARKRQGFLEDQQTLRSLVVQLQLQGPAA